MTSEAASFPRRQTMLAMFAAVAFFGAVSVAQAQSTTASPSQTTPSSSDTNHAASQGTAPGASTTMGSDRSTSGSTTMSNGTTRGSSMTSQADPSSPTRSGDGSMSARNAGSATGSPTQVNPSSQDSNRQASQGMVPSTDQDSSRARINAPGSDLRNDRTTMARAPRADRN